MLTHVNEFRRESHCPQRGLDYHFRCGYEGDD
jgi:hypothetical protein